MNTIDNTWALEYDENDQWDNEIMEIDGNQIFFLKYTYKLFHTLCTHLLLLQLHIQ